MALFAQRPGQREAPAGPVVILPFLSKAGKDLGVGARLAGIVQVDADRLYVIVVEGHQQPTQ